MATELELTIFEQELKMVSDLPEAKRWQLERDSSVPLGLFVIMHPISQPNELYKAKIVWMDYFAPFSLKFVNILTGKTDDPSAWPKCYGFRPSSLDVCLPWTSEGQALHPEWINSASQKFPKIELPMQYALLQLQFSLDGNYEGRGK